MENVTMEDIKGMVAEKLTGDKGQMTINVTQQQLGAAAKGIVLREIKQAIPALEAACSRAIAAAEIFGDLCQFHALKGGVEASVLKAFISARCKKTTEAADAKASQLALLFDEFAD